MRNILLLLTLICSILIIGCGGDHSNLTSPEKIKEAALVLDDQIWQRFVDSMDAHNKVVEGLDKYANNRVTRLSMYEYCKNAYDYQMKISYTSINDKTGAKDYIDSCYNATLNAQTAAGKLADYFENGKISDLSAAKEHITQVESNAEAAAVNRALFLTQAGCTVEEIENQVNKTYN